MKKSLVPILQYINYYIAFLAIALGLLIPFFASPWNLPGSEQILYTVSFITFGIAFILFAYAYRKFSNKVPKSNAGYFLAANVVTFILLSLLFLSFNNRLSQSKYWMTNPSVAKARIYKIDPEGYRKERTMYYTFEHKGQRYNGSLANPPDKYNIGDSVRVVFSQKDPDENRIHLADD